MSGIVYGASQDIGPVALEEWPIIAAATTNRTGLSDEVSAFEVDENLFDAVRDALRNEAEVLRRSGASLRRAISLRRADGPSAATSSSMFDEECERGRVGLREEPVLLPSERGYGSVHSFNA